MEDKLIVKYLSRLIIMLFFVCFMIFFLPNILNGHILKDHSYYETLYGSKLLWNETESFYYISGDNVCVTKNSFLWYKSYPSKCYNKVTNKTFWIKLK